jgi:DNA-binding CsgD family transcriptional regulator
MDDRQTRGLVEFLEAVYSFETDDEAWLRRVTTTAASVTRHAIVGSHSAIYDASDVAAFRILTYHVDGPPSIEAILLRSLDQFTPPYVTRSFRTLLLSSSARRDSAPELDGMFESLDSFGIGDILGVNGLDPAGMGTFLGLWVAETPRLDASESAVFRRMAHHLGAAHRCRRRLREEHRSLDVAEGAEAVLDPRGRVIHALGPATEKTAQADLVAMSKAREIALGLRSGREQGLRSWRPLTSARWTLVEHFERDGARYVVARENQAKVSGLLALSDRERQVVAYAALGQSTKETACALGISDTTVRVHLAHAAAKVGVRTRRQLLRHPEVERLRSTSGATNERG